MSEEDEVWRLQARRDWISTWLQQHSNAHQLLPYLQADLDFTIWEIDVRMNQPEPAREIPLPKRAHNLYLANEELQRALPLMPQYDKQRVIQVTAASASGTADVYTYLAQVSNIAVPAAQEYANHYAAQYQTLQQTYGRVDLIRGHLGKLRNPQTQARFERALQEYMSAKSAVGKRPAAANEMRNLIYGVQGDLFEIARRWPKENMTWEEMAARLTPGGRDSFAFKELVHQEAVFSSLIHRLSDVSKDREGGSITNLDSIWTTVLDHIYVVLSLAAIG